MKEAYIMVNEKNCGVIYYRIYEGCGDNLWDEDVEEGFVDYINYESFTVGVECDEFVVEEEDGGMVLCEKLVADMTMDEFINMVLDEEFGYTTEGEPIRPHYEVIESHE